MKIHTRHAFPGTLEQFWASWWDEELDARLTARSDVRRERLEQVKDGAITRSRMRFHTPYALPSLVQRAMGASTLSYEQVTMVDEAAGLVRWEVIPPVYPDKVKATGTVRIQALPGGGVERLLEGEVVVGVPLVGGTMEKAILDGIVKGHDEDAVIRTAWLRETFGS
ncbi:MAG: DUF2505 family protein [Alphaproteobacteria bacterium]|nr:DUF2505 family protein [Alphaproteobacteria bacterium]